MRFANPPNSPGHEMAFRARFTIQVWRNEKAVLSHKNPTTSVGVTIMPTSMRRLRERVSLKQNGTVMETKPLDLLNTTPLRAHGSRN